ncbi:MAG TPA: hypothetical protein VK753_03550 [Xanthomonadaceae bacterium]|nr:hypothetical protein [Xanthomonadaceae bacterium]
MIGDSFGKTMAGCSRVLCIAGVVALIAGCSMKPRPQIAPPPPVVVAMPATDFTIAAGMLDTWNAIGQILVRTDGVTYEGRAQMLGLYDVRYRGDRFLIVTRALTLTSERKVMTTRVAAVRQDGKPDGSAAAVALLGTLQARLPEEIRLDAAGVRGKKKY